MRAGSLSDPRVVALLRTHFLCAQVPELCTKDLIPDRRDVELLERLNRELRGGRHGPTAPDLFGGEREVFFSAAGELVDIFLSLNLGQDKATDQYTRAVRARPDFAVEAFFDRAAKALKETYGHLPDDFAALHAGTAPAVEAVRQLVPPQRRPTGRGVDLLVHTRSDLVMYEGLVGSQVVGLTPSEARQLVPELLAADATRAWPDTLAQRLAAAFYPRGGGVMLAIEPENVVAQVTARITEVQADHGGVRTVRGALMGRYRLAATTATERGQRDSYRPFRSAAGELAGDFEFDAAIGRLTSLRLVSRDGRCRFQHGPEEKASDHRVGVELLVIER